MKLGDVHSCGVFASEFQGGQFVEVLGTQGTNPLSQWKVLGVAKTLQKVYDKAIKGSAWSTSSGAPVKLQAPRDEKTVLGLVQPFLVLQVSLQQGQPLTVELGVQDNSSTRRRLILSSSFTDAKITPLHCQVPFATVARGTWLNLVIPLSELMTILFRSVGFRSLDTILITGSCKLRRVFTLRDAPYDTVHHFDQYAASHHLPLPKSLDWPPELDVFTQVVDARLLQSMGVELAALAKPSSRGMDTGRAPLGPKPSSDSEGRALGRGISTPSKAPGARPPQADMALGPAVMAMDRSSSDVQQASDMSWATVVKQDPRPTCTQLQPSSRGSSRSTARQPAGAAWDANATDGMRSRSMAVQPGSPTTGQSRLGALLPEVNHGFSPAVPGRPTTDSCMVTNRIRMGGPVAGRRAVSAQVVMRGCGTPPQDSCVSASRACPAAGINRLGLQQVHSVPVAGRRASPDTGFRAVSPARDLSCSKLEVGMAVRTSSACLNQSSGALSDLGMLLGDVPRMPASPNNRYSRRNGPAVTGPGVNIPYTIQEGEAVSNTPRGRHGSAVSCQPSPTKVQYAAAAKAEHVTTTPGTDNGYSPSWSSPAQQSRQGQGGTTSTGMARVRAQSPGALSYLRQANSAGLPGSPPSTGSCSPAAKLTPKSSSPNLASAPPSSAAANVQKAAPTQGVLASPGRACARSPARREQGTTNAPQASHTSTVPDLEGLLQVKGGLDDSADMGPLPPRLSAGCIGSPAAIAQVDSPAVPLRACGKQSSKLDMIAAAEACTSALAQQGGLNSPLIQGVMLPAKDPSSGHLSKSTSFTRDRYARMSSSSGTGLKPAALSRMPSRADRNQPEACAVSQEPASQHALPTSLQAAEAAARSFSGVTCSSLAPMQPASLQATATKVDSSPAATSTAAVAPGRGSDRPAAAAAATVCRGDDCPAAPTAAAAAGRGDANPAAAARAMSPSPQRTSGIPSVATAASPSQQATRPSVGLQQPSAIPSSPASAKPTTRSTMAHGAASAAQQQEPGVGQKPGMNAKQVVAGSRQRVLDAGAGVPAPSTAATAGIASPSKLLARGASPGRAVMQASAAAATAGPMAPNVEHAKQGGVAAAKAQRGKARAPRPPSIPGIAAAAGGRDAGTGTGSAFVNGGQQSPPDAMPGGPTPRMYKPATGTTGQARGMAGTSRKQSEGMVSQTSAASTAFTRGSVASSVCEIDESVNLTAFGGFGVDEDDVLASSHFRPCQAASSSARELEQTGVGEATAALDLSTAASPMCIPARQPAQGLQVEGLGGPVWSNTTPSMRQPHAPADGLLSGAAHQGGEGAAQHQASVAVAGQPAGMSTGLPHHTFTFPHTGRAGAETPHAQHGRAHDNLQGHHAHDHFHADFYSSVAVGGPLRRYTVDDDTLFSTGSLRAHQQLQQGRDIDWAHVEQLMAAPVDLAAAARAYTPPVIIPSFGRPAGVGSSTASIGPQVLTVNASQETLGSFYSLQGNVQTTGQGMRHSTSVQERGPAGALRRPNSLEGDSVGKSVSTNGREGVVQAGGAVCSVTGPAVSGKVRTRMGAARRSARPAQAPEEMVDLVYDPVLNCYYDHKTGNYFALKQ